VQSKFVLIQGDQTGKEQKRTSPGGHLEGPNDSVIGIQDVLAHQLSDRFKTQRSQRDDPAPWLAHDAVNRWPGRPGHGTVGGAQKPHPSRLETPAQVVQPHNRLVVTPLHVIHGQEHGTSLGHELKKGLDVLRGTEWRRGKAAWGGDQKAQAPSSRISARPDQISWIEPGQNGMKQLAGHAERTIGFRFAAAGLQDVDVRTPGQMTRRIQKSSFPEAGATLDHHRGGASP
jgi:hypothetical protein